MRKKDGMHCMKCGGRIIFNDEKKRTIIQLAYDPDMGVIVDNPAYACNKCGKLHWSDGSEVIIIKMELQRNVYHASQLFIGQLFCSFQHIRSRLINKTPDMLILEINEAQIKVSLDKI